MPEPLYVNNILVDCVAYSTFHERRIARSIELLRRCGARRVIELGGHPWVMTSALIDAQFEIAATVSAEEVMEWPDSIPIRTQEYRLRSSLKQESRFRNYSANLERTLFDIGETADTVVACEIIEHLVRSPHIMLLNINRWLPIGGKLLITTPNGAQFNNPFRRKSVRPAYRCNVYARHHYLFTLHQLIDLAELCGFTVCEAGYWDVYSHGSIARLYSLLGSIPLSYFQQKFRRTIYLTAEKQRDVRELERLPGCYAPSPDWEFIRWNGHGR